MSHSASPARGHIASRGFLAETPLICSSSRVCIPPGGVDNTNQLRAMVVMNFVFSFFYTFIGIISWVYPAEIFPVDIRNQGNSVTTFTNWTINLVFAQFSPTALTKIGFRYFYVFFVFNIIAMVCYIFFFPETKGKMLEQMDLLFGDHIVPPSGEEKQETTLVEHVQ
jgi:hypothetical protein